MDVGYDFLTPELMHAIFFEQKNVVLFPYLDIKHLRALELFTTGHSSVELDCTALNDISTILEHQAGSYSQSPPLFFMFNANGNIIQSVKDIENVRYVINTHENVELYANGSQLLFYNKKVKKFVNSSIEDFNELDFENDLFRQSQGDQDVLQDLLMRIKSIATRIYKELIESRDVKRVQSILEEHESIFPRKHWNRILQFTQNFYHIVIPEDLINNLTTSISREISSKQNNSPQVTESDFSREYEAILSTNRAIAQAFISSLHDYRSEYVNPANLEMVQLYDPKELYNYLRNHHWKDGISEDFVEQWVTFKDVLDDEEFELLYELFSKLNISLSFLKLGKKNPRIKSVSPQINPSTIIEQKLEKESYTTTKNNIPIPSINNFKQFKEWILAQLDKLEQKR